MLGGVAINHWEGYFDTKYDMRIDISLKENVDLSFNSGYWCLSQASDFSVNVGTSIKEKRGIILSTLCSDTPTGW